MKKIYNIVLILLAFSQVLSAQRLHKIIYADTNDPSIGKAARVSEIKYANTLMQIETALTWGNSPGIIVRDSFDCNKTMLLKDIENLDCTSEDIVIFVYCGHGSRSTEDKSDYPQMCFAIPKGKTYRSGNDYYLLENVRNLIMQKCPRLCIVIGDCCNSYDPNLSPKNIVESMGEKDVLYGQGAKCCRNLLLSKYGSVMLTASIKGEYGWCDDSNGMVLQNNFSIEFDKVFNEIKCYDSWSSLLSTIQQNTKSTYIRDKHGKVWTQTPLYSINLSDTKPDKCRKDTTIIEPKANDLKSDILKLADNKHYTPDQRRNMRPGILNKYFDNKDALVDIVGKNGNIIMSLTIDKYLRRISTEENMANIIIYADEKAKSGKTMYLKIHEIYLKN